MDTQIVSCDWGTSRLRLRLVDVETARVLGEVTAACGVKETYRAWSAAAQDRVSFFSGVLVPLLRELEQAAGRPCSDAVVVASGMASSSIGMRELPYAPLPFALDGASLPYHRFEPDADRPFPLLLLSGVRSESDVMRGEETELIGVWEALGRPRTPALYVVPGTHSKHVLVEEGAIGGFRTFMTGELFDVLRSGSILRDATAASAFSEAARAAFRRGVEAAAQAPLLHALFTVRTNALFRRLPAESNYWYFSGLLIGAELHGLAGHPHPEIVLCADARLRPLYGAALEVLGAAERATQLPAPLVERSGMLGHLAFYRRILRGDPSRGGE